MEIDNALDVKSSKRSIVFNEPNYNLKKNNLNKSAILLSQKKIINNSYLKEQHLNTDILIVKITSEKSALKYIQDKKKRKILPLFDLNSIKNFFEDSSISRQSEKSEEIIIKRQIEESEENEKSQENKDNIIKRQVEESLEREEFRLSKYCLICYKRLTYKEYYDNNRICEHFFCDDCYYLYLKEKINNNINVDKITCPKGSCGNIIDDNFIEKKLIKDIPLIEKYKKLKERRQIIYNPNYQICPYPDCGSYAKKGNNKYVSCIHNGHKFCLICLKNWHGNESCQIDHNESFEKWKDTYKVKRCPKCKYFIEKNDGCNHITCSNCNYQWCWICLNEYDSNHFDMNGKCFGLQYAKCKCFSNKLCLFLYELLIILLKFLGLSILTPFILFIALHQKFYDEIDYFDNFVSIVSSFSIFFLCLSFGILLISISAFISIIITIFWPLQNIIIDKLLNII